MRLRIQTHITYSASLKCHNPLGDLGEVSNDEGLSISIGAGGCVVLAICMGSGGGGGIVPAFPRGSGTPRSLASCRNEPWPSSGGGGGREGSPSWVGDWVAGISSLPGALWRSLEFSSDLLGEYRLACGWTGGRAALVFIIPASCARGFCGEVVTACPLVVYAWASGAACCRVGEVCTEDATERAGLRGNLRFPGLAVSFPSLLCCLSISGTLLLLCWVSS